MTPIERAASALSEAGGAANWEHALEYARAVLRAVREPSDIMRLVGGYTQKYGETEEERYAYAIWQAMIDAALEEGPAGE
jgi:hypothetical protein